MKNIKLVILGLFIAFTPTLVTLASSEISVKRNGEASISGAKIMQIAGSTFFARLYWGDSFMRFTIRTSPTTKFTRATGEATTINEIKDGDILDVSGALEPQSSTLTLLAAQVKNSSVQKEQAVVSGTVISVDNSDARSFLMNNKERGVINVKVSTTTTFFKGTRTLDFDHLRAGDKILKASGDFDIPTKTLAAQSITIYIDSSIFKPRNFTGKLIEVPSTDATLLKVSINKVPYTVFLTSKTLILRANKSTTTLQRFIAGDPIRLYGAIREVDEPMIDAEVIRNTNL